ncbi:hypothetical protein [Bacillus sp. AFS031507]|uniref:hypothetical protein n=1 Tax=Bacillus sp. AFS031507 TaxID=2033496 RepID=UPI000BFDF362|nr:hypothetical protein [Bacillus sp. AFS031507]PGY06311.1 hypothetical protein COE25_28220 [Bacillus sp. AFS031507]
MTINKRVDSDEAYIINLCDEILGIKGSRQHKFAFLRGDRGKNNMTRELPVDVYYERLNLVIEYKEKQHYEPTPFFDKPGIKTISGVSRGEQRKIYDQRRREVLPKHGINLLELSYKDFQNDSRKRIIRNQKNDKEILKVKLKKWI